MKKIAVVRYTALGDLVTLEPSFRAIRHFYPDHTIDFYTSSLGKGLYEDTGYFDRFIIRPSLLDIVREDSYYEYVFNFQCTKPSFLQVMLMKKKKVINKTSFWNKVLKRKQSLTIEEMLLLGGIESKKIATYFRYQHSKNIKLPVDKELQLLPRKTKKRVVIAPGASERWETKKWGKENFAQLIRFLRDYEIVLVGTEIDYEDVRYIAYAHSNVVNLVGKTSLKELKAIFAKSDLFIGNDSGPAHIAAAVGTPTITIFGPTSLKHCVKNFYHGAQHICVQSKQKLDCMPCYKTKCPYNLECMQMITPDTIAHYVQKILES